MNQKTVNVSFAFGEIADMVTGAMLVADALDHRTFDNDDDARAAPGALAAMLRLLSLHLENWQRCFRGEIDPLMVWTPRSASPLIPLDDTATLDLPVWDSATTFEAAQLAKK